jgi:hypothetical protein
LLPLWSTEVVGLSAVAGFLAGGGVDHAGRAIADVLAFDDATLEARHDFIQWLFPLAEPSGAVPSSPVLSAADVAAIRASAAAQANLRAGAERMLGFYQASGAWLRGYDHNHLRITRIIKSLRLLAGDSEADGFRAAICELARARGARINATTLRYWDSA